MTLLSVRTVALEAVFREDRSDIAVEGHRFKILGLSQCQTQRHAVLEKNRESQNVGDSDGGTLDRLHKGRSIWRINGE